MMTDIEKVERLIEENIKEKRKYINLSNLQLTGKEKSLELLQNNQELQEINLSYNKITDISFLQNTNNLSYLDLNNNEVSDIYPLKGLKSIQRLNLSYNNIKNIFYLKDLKNLLSLNLANNNIITQSIYVIEYLNELKSINLNANEIFDFSVIRNLINLNSISISYNQINDLSFLDTLFDLKTVNASHNNIYECSTLTNIKQIQNLDLSFNNIVDLSFLLGLSELEVLELKGNNETKFSLYYLDKLPKLREFSISDSLLNLHLNFHNRKRLYNYLRGSIHLEKNFDKILNIDLSSLGLKGEEIVLQKLKEAKSLINLDLRGNSISSLSNINGLKNVKTIDLAFNEISDVSMLKKLENIESIDLSYNNITNIELSFINQFSNLQKIYLHGNKIKNIPKEIYDHHGENVLEEVKNYLKSIEKEENRKELNEAKLIFVGVGEVGKTELSEALSEVEYKFEEGRKSTTGIRIKPWQLADCKREEQKIDFIAHIWDFAGQEIKYGTHQFFLTKNSIYVFVWETRKGEDASKFAYWLRIVSLLSKNAPVLIVQNKIDEIESEVNQKQWKEQFPNIVGFYKTSCKEGTGINELRADIQNQLIELPHTREIWNKYRVAVRDELIESSKNTDYISYKEYLKVCEKHTVSKEDASFLSDQLHNIGSILHFSEDARLKNTVVLNSEWVTDAAYLLLDTKKVTNGRFDFSELDEIWEDERFDEKHEFLIKLLEKFELIFQFQDSDLYIVPEGLPVEEPQGIGEIQPTFESEKTKYLRFEYHYPFMPKGILSRFICRLHENIFKEYFWKNGVVLVLDKETFAKVILNEVENPKTIKIEVWGRQADKLLAIIRRNIEHIHSKFEELEIFQKIPCVCVDCKDSSKPHLHDYDTLIRFQEKGKTTRECAIGAEDVEIATLLEGILDTKTIRGNRLVDLIERNNVSEFFAELDRMGIRGNEIASLKDEFISGTNDFRFHSRLITLVSKF